MNTSATMDDIAESGANGARRSGRHVKRGAERVKRSAEPEIATLIADVEDLLRKVGHIADIEVAQVRERLVAKIATVKDALNSQGRHIASAARDAASATDDYVHENPWKSTGLAALAGVILGLVIFRK